MLLASEAHFFDQPATHHQEQNGTAQEMRTFTNLRNLLRSPLIHANIALQA